MPEDQREERGSAHESDRGYQRGPFNIGVSKADVVDQPKDECERDRGERRDFFECSQHGEGGCEASDDERTPRGYPLLVPEREQL